MKLAVGSWQLAVGGRIVASFCVFFTAFFQLNCSVPNLEAPECTESRDTVKGFYSWYIATDADERAKRPEIFERYISSSFSRNPRKWETDPFLLNDFPKAFRVGECKMIEPGKRTDFQILLFWKDDTRSEQRVVHAEVVKENDKWLIDNVKP